MASNTYNGTCPFRYKTCPSKDTESRAAMASLILSASMVAVGIVDCVGMSACGMWFGVDFWFGSGTFEVDDDGRGRGGEGAAKYGMVGFIPLGQVVVVDKDTRQGQRNKEERRGRVGYTKRVMSRV